MSEKLRNGQRRMLTKTEAKTVVDQWVGSRSEEELNQQVVKSEIKKLEKKTDKIQRPTCGTYGGVQKAREVQNHVQPAQQRVYKHGAARQDRQSAQPE